MHILLSDFFNDWVIIEVDLIEKITLYHSDPSYPHPHYSSRHNVSISPSNTTNYHVPSLFIITTPPNVSISPIINTIHYANLLAIILQQTTMFPPPHYYYQVDRVDSINPNVSFLLLPSTQIYPPPTPPPNYYHQHPYISTPPPPIITTNTLTYPPCPPTRRCSSYVESLCCKIGINPPHLTPKQQIMFKIRLMVASVSIANRGVVRVRMCVWVCVSVCVCGCMCARVCVCGWVGVIVRAFT